MGFLNLSTAGSILSKTPPSNQTPWFSQQTSPRQRERLKFDNYGRNRALVHCSSPAKEVDLQIETDKCGNVLVMKYGWCVRRMAQVGEEMTSVAHVQAEAFHVPMALFNNLFFEFFKAEVLSALIYKIRNSPPDRYACLVAESVNANCAEEFAEMGIVGVVDVTVQREADVIKHFQDAEEYLYISGISVPTKFRRRKIATALLEACDALAVHWGFECLALRAYEGDVAARKLYENAGYKIVFADPSWFVLFGRKRRILMVKQRSLFQ